MQVNYLILALTTRCNLRCTYCYHGEPQVRQDMDSATLERAFTFVAEGTEPLHIQLTGGEPCLVPHLIEEAVERARQLQRPFTMGVQTNSTLLDKVVVDIFRRSRLQVGVSLDGSSQMQEALRGQAAASLRGLMLLENEQIPFRVTTVVCHRNADQLDRLAWLLAGFSQARGIGLDLLVTKGNARAGGGGPEPAQSSLLIRGVETLVKALAAINGHRQIPLQFREWSLVRRMLAQPRQPGRSFCQAGLGASLAVHPDGRLFPCGQTLGDSRFALDSVATTSFPVFAGVHLTGPGRDCTGCPLEHRCPNDCPSRLLANPLQAQVLACDLYRTLAQASLQQEQANPAAAPYPQDGYPPRKK
jgi:Arylsulfatase regulator (Fe-S oxidoreductase)